MGAIVFAAVAIYARGIINNRQFLLVISYGRCSAVFNAGVASGAFLSFNFWCYDKLLEEIIIEFLHEAFRWILHPAASHRGLMEPVRG